MDEDKFEEFIEQIDQRLYVKELKVVEVRRKNIKFRALLQIYGVDTLERAVKIWGKWPKKKREEMGLFVDSCTIFQESQVRDFMIRLDGMIQKEALR